MAVEIILAVEIIPAVEIILAVEIISVSTARSTATQVSFSDDYSSSWNYFSHSESTTRSTGAYKIISTANKLSIWQFIGSYSSGVKESQE